MRVESNRPAPSRKDGTPAWVHDIQGAGMDRRIVKQSAKRKKTTEQLLEIVQDAFWDSKAEEARKKVADELGVSVRALESMRVGYADDSYGEHTIWPCRSHDSTIIGAVRRYGDGKKLALRGGSIGLFYSMQQDKLSKCPILIVEGGSDVAAAYTIGFSAIGRPSNTGGADLILAMNLSHPLVVMGENDFEPSRRGGVPSCPVDCDGCAHCHPGMFGAKKTAERLGCGWVLPPPGCKDLRDVLAQGRVSEFLQIVSRM